MHRSVLLDGQALPALGVWTVHGVVDAVSRTLVTLHPGGATTRPTRLPATVALGHQLRRGEVERPRILDLPTAGALDVVHLVRIATLLLPLPNGHYVVSPCAVSRSNYWIIGIIKTIIAQEISTHGTVASMT